MEIKVDLGTRSYTVAIEKGTAIRAPSVFQPLLSGKSGAVVTDTAVASLYRQHLDTWKNAGFPAITINAGERYKTIETWSAILDKMLELRLDRKSVVIAFGGGVVGDVAGFASAAFMRGIDYIQVPTTLLAMVDSSVGGKTAVDHPKGKNLIGAFHQPRLVVVDTSFLDTLPPRQFLAGYAELFKYAFIGGRRMFDFVKENHGKMIRNDDAALSEGIYNSIETKARTVEKDEFETSGARAVLNFGHTFAHSLERFFGFDRVLHGEAVFWGMKCACELGFRTGAVPLQNRKDYEEILSLMPLPALPSKPDPRAIYDAMFTDKKASSGRLRFVVPAEPGTSIIAGDIKPEVIIAVLQDVFRF